MEIWLSPALGAGLLLTATAWLHLARRRRQGARERRHHDALQLALELLQNLQKHRGLGPLKDAPSLHQRAAIAQQLEQLWQRWPSAECRLPALAAAWPALRGNPADFNGHCQLIERLLAAIQLLELRLGEHHAQVSAALGEACRALEDLGRLRALAVRAANHPRCPLELQIQMRYLCQRLAGPACEQRVREVIGRLERELIGAAKVRLAPTDCFALLTPIIDERLQGLRASLA
ncbi:MAG: hypothetical protein ACRERY_13225 [Pseudomonas sp.]